MEKDDAIELLKEVRHILEVPEGASLIRIARKRMRQIEEAKDASLINI